MSRLSLWFFVLALFSSVSFGAETLPPKPSRHFNDYARLVTPEAAQSLDAKLAQFERDTTNQIVVAIFTKMPSASSAEDFAVRTAQSWGVGRKGRNNGAVLFIFVQDRQAYISTGYGLEGALPDALCFQIIDQQLKPRFGSGDYAGGINATIDSMIAATRGEYRADPRASSGSRSSSGGSLLIFLIFIIVVSALKKMGRGNRSTGSWHHGRGSSGGWLSGGGFGGGSWGGGGGGGGFSGGGGSFGGGGAGGKW